MIGERVGNYRVDAVLGQGGMGEVFLATQVVVGTEVAIKVLRRDLSADVALVGRFFDEARAVARVRHPGVVQIFDVGTLPDGRAYLVMERLRGGTLAQRLAGGRTLDLGAALALGAQLAGALDAVHAAGVVHRDLKPANVFVGVDADVVGGLRATLLDFGVAKLVGTISTGRGGPTQGTLGTPAYMAPEQWGDAGTVDGRADLYALGCVLVEVLAGRPPFVVTSFADACGKHLTQVPPPLDALAPGVPPALTTLVAQLLAKDPAARPRRGRDVAEALGALAGASRRARASTLDALAPDEVLGATVAPTPTPRPAAVASTASTPRAGRGRRGLVVAAGLGVVGVGVALAWPRPEPAAVPVAATTPAPVAVPVAAPPPAPVAAAVVDAAPAPVADAGAVPPPAVAPDARRAAASTRPPAVDAATVREGSIDVDLVHAVLREASPDLTACYLQAGQPDLGGKVMVRMLIDARGRLGEVTATGLDTGLGACVVAAMRRRAWPAPVGGPIDVRLPIVFEARAADGAKLTDRLDRTQLTRGMNALRQRITACAPGEVGVVAVWFNISPAGTVVEARVEDELAGTPAAACMEAVARGATFAPTRLGQTVSYPFNLDL